MPFLLDANLYHPDIRDDRRTVSKCLDNGGDGIMKEAHQVCHRKIAYRNRTALPDPVIKTFVPDHLPGKRPGRFRYLVRLIGSCTRINICTCGDIPVA
jgi:hypothetical protein